MKINIDAKSLIIKNDITEHCSAISLQGGSHREADLSFDSSLEQQVLLEFPDHFLPLLANETIQERIRTLQISTFETGFAQSICLFSAFEWKILEFKLLIISKNIKKRKGIIAWGK
ncbi:hypothetical protein [Thermaerobacillus caldiproteolyticus]|uniref:Uncharacterized protein n=1 Tax=Thermaerobacillus caldiproteolyticus TaxID=247480 RepID=A0A7V9Z4Z9_9BACL|nr:hypothetical protein [Anoxybacillus caldiproteolyticus]MBA2874182.1 hypothetical protein [Anoxybacillus caldiproteolyticus]